MKRTNLAIKNFCHTNYYEKFTSSGTSLEGEPQPPGPRQERNGLGQNEMAQAASNGHFWYQGGSQVAGGTLWSS